jgi:hypothetical protein
METRAADQDDSFDDLVVRQARRQFEILHSTGYRHAARHVRHFVDGQDDVAPEVGQPISSQ